MFPALAKQNFDRLKKSVPFTKLFRRLLLSLSRIPCGASRALASHQEIDTFIAEALKNPVAEKNLKCKRSCTFCCHTQVSVTQDEVELLIHEVKQKGIKLDLERLKLQSLVSEYSKDFYRLDYEDRKCVFLNDQGECGIYEHRPAVCRINYSFSEPIQCSTEDGIEKTQRLLRIDKADLVIMAAFKLSKRVGSLPRLLWEQLNS